MVAAQCVLRDASSPIPRVKLIFEAAGGTALYTTIHCRKSSAT